MTDKRSIQPPKSPTHALGLNHGKHPETLVADRYAPSQRVPVNNSQTTFITENRNARFIQQDIYIQPTYDKPAVPSVAAIDVIGKKTVQEKTGNIYFERDKTDLKTAGANAAQSKRDDAQHYLRAKAAEFIRLHTLPGNEALTMEVEGHASYSGHAKIDKIKDAKGAVREVAHNDWLSEQRGLNTHQEMVALVGKTNPELVGLIKLVEPKGDRELRVKTHKEHNENRNVEIKILSQQVNEEDRRYRVLHLDKTNIDPLQQQNQKFTFDLNTKTDIGAELKNRSTKTAAAARGTIVLEHSELARPIDIDVMVDKADDFRFLIKGEQQAIAYKRTSAGTVVVTANDKPLATLHYRTSDGAPVKDQDILVGAMNPQGAIAYGRRDGIGEANDLVAQREAEQKTIALKRELIATINTDGDDKITTAEITAAKRKLQQHANIEAVGPELTNKQFEFIYKRKLDNYGRAAAEEYKAHVREISGIGTNEAPLSISKEQMLAAKQKDAAFTKLLGDFKMPATGGMPIADVLASAEPLNPAPTSSNAQPGKGPKSL